MMGTPYASASSGATARDEITKVLRRFGCESVGFMDDFEKGEVMLAFILGDQVSLMTPTDIEKGSMIMRETFGLAHGHMMRRIENGEFPEPLASGSRH